jgi:hypothetical protein
VEEMQILGSSTNKEKAFTMNNREIAQVDRFEMYASNRSMKHRIWYKALREYLRRHPTHTLDGYMRDCYPHANDEIDTLMGEIGYEVFLEEHPDIAAKHVTVQGRTFLTQEVVRAHVAWMKQHGLISATKANNVLACETSEDLQDVAGFYKALDKL